MNRHVSSIVLTLATASFCLLAGLAGPVQAAPAPGTVDLITTPPELTTKVAPNVVLTYDDSGSMGWDYMPDKRPYDDGAWGSPWQCAGVIDGTFPATATDPANPKTWPMNGVFFNPNTTYRVPVYQNGTSFPAATYTAAWTNGIQHNRPQGASASGTTNLSTMKWCGRGTGGSGYYYYTGPALALDASGDLNATSLTNLYKTANWSWQALTTSQQQNFANWYSYYRIRTYAAMSATSLAFQDFDKGIRVAWQNINRNNSASPWFSGGSTRVLPFENNGGNTTRTDFYNWLFQNPANGNTPNQAAAVRAGTLFTYGATANTNTTLNPYWDPDTSRELSCRKNFHIQMTDGLWNNATATTATNDNNPIPRTLPDGRSYAKISESKIYWNELGPTARSMADIGFHFWATDLRPDFQGNAQTKLKVNPYRGDSTTGVTNTIPLGPGDNWLDNKEMYWNPANNPATWPHLVQYMIGFGVSGTIPRTDANLLKLRLGTLDWPATALGTDDRRKIDDMWHAAINSRGEFFAAANPDELIDAMKRIIASVVAQSSSSTPARISLPILTGGDSAYQGGYDTTGWPGTFKRSQLDATGTVTSVVWDAGCLLTGGNCADPAATGLPARAPNSRIILTSNGTSSGRAFRWSSLDAAQKDALNKNPTVAGTCVGVTGSCDGHGSLRVDYFRGDRTQEAAAASPRFHLRTSVLGAIINSEAAYVSSPRSGYHDIFPPGSPEANAALLGEQYTYAGYQNAERNRTPMVYVGANDGMLHAFDASTGTESWAFIPNTLIRNGRLGQATINDTELKTGVDAPPRTGDVFIKGEWRTVLVGSLRLGGRGVYALDVSKASVANESAGAGPTGPVLWEFNSGSIASTASDPPCASGSTSCASLGYTYDSVNIARLRYQNKWVAVVASGYFPESIDAAANPADITEAAANRTSLLVIDLETGKLIREIPTSIAPQTRPTGFKSFGLSTPMVYDEGGDEVDDVVYAGDLAGNLWRFDLSDPTNANNWKVDLMFSNYSTGGTAAAGNQPFTFNPTALRDPVTLRPILVVGSGKYLGESDRVTTIPQQAYYGIRDYGPASPYYPIRVEQLVTQTLAQSAGDVRSITGYTKPTTGVVPSSTPPMRLNTLDMGGNAIVESVPAHGWRIRLNIATEKGERAQRRAIPLPTANAVLLYGLIPKSDDPCDPGARYSIMALNAASGAAITGGGGISSGRGDVGAVVAAPAPPSDPVNVRGGGTGRIIGLPSTIPPAVSTAINQALSEGALPPWHRSAWRELLGW